MIRIRKKSYEKLVADLIYTQDIREIVKKFSVDRIFYYSVLKDISNGRNSPNYHILQNVARKTNLSESFIVEQAKSVLNFYVPYYQSESPDYYKILNVKNDATEEEIRRSWIELMKSYHPDKVGPDGLDISKKINEAYEVLGDIKKRDIYDRKHLPYIPVFVSDRRLSERLYYAVPLIFVAFVALVYWADSGLVFKPDEGVEEQAEVVEDASQTQIASRSTPSEADTDVSKAGKQDEAETGGGNVRPDKPESGETARVQSGQEMKTETAEKKSEKVADESLAGVKEDESDNVAEAPEEIEEDAAKVQSAQIKDETEKMTETPGPADIDEKSDTGIEEEHQVAEIKDKPEDSTVKDDKKAGVASKEEIAEDKEQVASAELKKEHDSVEDVSANEAEAEKLKTTPYGKAYTVRKGDTLWTIAWKFDTRTAELKRLNNLTDNKLRIGDELIISGIGIPAPPVSEESVKTPPEKKAEASIVVAKGESPVKAAVKAGTAENIVPVLATPAVASEKIEKPVAVPDRDSLYVFVSEYVAAYKNRDIAGVKSLFAPDAVENGVNIATVLNSYSSNFANMEIISYDIDVKNAAVHNHTGSVAGKFFIKFKDRRTGVMKNSRGRINWRLIWSGGIWKITELSYRVEKTDSAGR